MTTNNLSSSRARKNTATSNWQSGFTKKVIEEAENALVRFLKSTKKIKKFYLTFNKKE